MICIHSIVITHCDMTMKVPSNIITHCDVTMGITNNGIAYCDVILSGPSHWLIRDHIPVYHIKQDMVWNKEVAWDKRNSILYKQALIDCASIYIFTIVMW